MMIASPNKSHNKEIDSLLIPAKNPFISKRVTVNF